jgi:RNA polymerase sigma-70 factor (ECF subfamily)
LSLGNRASTSAVVSGPSPVARAFEQEFDHVYRTLRRLGLQPAEAEDLAQDVFVVLWRRWDDFRSDQPLRPWLVGIAHRVAMEHTRKRRRREVVTFELEQEDHAPGPDERLASARARRLVLEALAILPERHRAVLVRHDLDGLSIRGIAEEWSIPFFTVAARLRRARLRFAKAVKQVQLRDGKRGALLPASLLLDAERSVPPAPAFLRALMRDRLTTLGQGAPPAVPAPAAVPLAPAIPRALKLGAIGVATAVVLLIGAFGRGAPTSASAVAEPRAAGSLDQSGAALTRGPVAHWGFEDGPGSEVAQDSTGNGRSCLLHDLDAQTAWVEEGPVGRALDLGATGWLECPLPEARAGVPFELSVAIWMKREPRKEKRDTVLLTRQLDGSGPEHLFWFGLREDFLAVWSWAWNGWTTGALPPPGGWTHVAFVHGGDETRLYVDGVMVRHKTDQRSRGEGLVRSALTIGGMRYQTDPPQVRHHFDGLVDEAVVYDRTLTGAEIAALASRRR